MSISVDILVFSSLACHYDIRETVTKYRLDSSIQVYVKKWPLLQLAMNMNDEMEETMRMLVQRAKDLEPRAIAYVVALRGIEPDLSGGIGQVLPEREGKPNKVGGSLDDDIGEGRDVVLRGRATKVLRRYRKGTARGNATWLQTTGLKPAFETLILDEGQFRHLIYTRYMKIEQGVTGERTDEPDKTNRGADTEGTKGVPSLLLHPVGKRPKPKNRLIV